jgi:hypothetical protein
MARFVKGQSGNPGGRPKDLFGIRDLARSFSPDAIKTLVAIMKDKGAPEAARVSAATAILDRGYGKPVQAISNPDGGPLAFEKIVVEVVTPK